MRIFVSYGHDCTEIVDRFVRDLEQMGHEVWMDQARIKCGNDWRDAIAEGIMNSQAVLAFLSRHSLRPGSVCLDELSISVACNRQIIQPILLEPNLITQIPATICGTQFLDCSSWRNYSGEAFEEWYAGKLKDLAALLDQETITLSDSQIQAVENWLRPHISHVRQLRELQKDYCARPWLNDAIHGWMEGETTKNMLLLGYPGSGKTCFCAHYFHYHPNTISIVFCEWSRENSGSTHQIIRNIAFQVAMKIPTYRKRLLWVMNNSSLSLPSLSSRELFEILLVDPLAYEIDGQHAPMLIVMDGIDENSHEGRNELAELIAEMGDHLPPFLRFLVTTRSDNLVLRHYSGAKTLQIRPDSAETAEDIRRYIAGRLDSVWEESVAARMIERLVGLCDGSFLYASLITDGILSGGIDLTDAAIYPESISGIYFQWMSRILPSEEVFQEKYYPALALLIAADGPVPVAFLKKALGWRDLALKNFLHLFRCFLLEQVDAQGERLLAFFHHSFAEWLSNESCVADVFYVSREDGLDELAEAMYDSWQDEEMSDYERLHIWDVFRKAKKKKWERELLKSEDFLRELLDLAVRYQQDRRTYMLAERILDQCQDFCEASDVDSDYRKMVQDGLLPFYRAQGLYGSGDYPGTCRVLEPALSAIRTFCGESEQMEALFILGTSQDLIGERGKSISCFRELLELATAGENTIYMIRALAGLAWNDHFSDYQEGLAVIERLSSLTPLTREGEMLRHLVMARFQLTSGKLEQALQNFEKAVRESEDRIWGYDSVSTRNQLLILEILVACYDNYEYEKGIALGRQILERLKDRGTIAECYCASWIAMNYLMNGQYAEAGEYLAIAERQNHFTDGACQSAWIDMHLKSVRAFYETEAGDLEAAIDLHRQVAEMAETCEDYWVMGDAHWELLLLHLERQEETAVHQCEVSLKVLGELGKKTQLPHICFKYQLLQGYYQKTSVENLLSQVYTMAEGETLPSTNMITVLYLMYRICLEQGYEQQAEILAAHVRHQIRKICEKNPAGAFKQRPGILRIGSEVGYEL